MTKRTAARAGAWVRNVLSTPAASATATATKVSMAAARLDPPVVPELSQLTRPVPEQPTAGAPVGVSAADVTPTASGTEERGLRIVRVQSIRRRTAVPRAAALIGFVLSLPAWAAAAAPSQEDVFRSIQHNVGGGDGSGTEGSGLVTFVVALAGLVALLVVASQWKWKRASGPRAMNHQGRLMREVLKAVPLRGREVRQLKVMAEHAAADKPLASPLTLLLCPSVMARTIQSKRLKIDRKALASVARRVGVQIVTK